MLRKQGDALGKFICSIESGDKENKDKESEIIFERTELSNQSAKAGVAVGTQVTNGEDAKKVLEEVKKKLIKEQEELKKFFI